MRECIQLHERHPNGSPIVSGQWEGGKLVSTEKHVQHSPFKVSLSSDIPSNLLSINTPDATQVSASSGGQPC